MPAEPVAPAYASTNWKAMASVTAAGNASVPSNAFDGMLATRWSTGREQAGDETFTLDLGASVPISRIVLDDTTHPSDYPAAYTLEASNTTTTFVTIKMGAGAVVTDIQFTRVTAQYVRIRQTAARPGWWSIDELRIYP
jgi:hypothetical protein